MGTYWNAAFVAAPALSTDRLREAVEEQFARVVRQMSFWDPESDLSRFNRAAGGAWQRLPNEFFDVLSRALEIAEETEGRFDPTVGEAVNAWGFGPAPLCERVPEKEGLLARMGWQRLRLDGCGTAAWQPGGISLDLSSIAKGFAVDLAASRLEALGVESYLIEIGGEFRGRGCKPDGQPWWCALELPPADCGIPDVPSTVVALCDGALATSGNYRRQRLVGGRRVSHLIDARTGSADTGELLSVTVYAATCMDADAYATALFCLGGETGLRFAERRGIAAAFRSLDGDAVVERLSSAMAAMLN